MKKKIKRWKNILRTGATIVCPYCLKPILKQQDLTIEHEPPKSRQEELGMKSETLYVCKKCNNEKGALTLEEYKEWLRLEAIRHGKLR